MTFRSDDDAREERVRSLEKQLEDARQELSVARPKVTRLEIAEKENRRLMAELSRSTGGATANRPGGSRGPLLALAGLVALLVCGLGAAGFVLAVVAPRRVDAPMPYPSSQDDVFAARQAEQQARAEAEAARSEAQAVRAEADALRAELLARAAMPMPPMPVAPIDPATLVDHSVDFAPIVRSARVVEVTGDAPVARRAHCRVSLTAEDGDCRAEVSCGDESLYPRTGSGGFFHCQVTDHVVSTGADLNPTYSSGDPRLQLDATAREITISDGPPEWSARVVYDAH